MTVCRMCQSSEQESITTDLSFGIDIYKCCKCGFIQSDYVSESALKYYYSELYRDPLPKEELNNLRELVNIGAHDHGL